MKNVLAFCSICFVAFTACGDDEMSPEMQTVEVSVRGVVGSETFACGQSYTEVGTSSSTFEGRDFRMYLSDVRLVDSSGLETPLELEQDGKWQDGSIVLLDFENGSGACEMGNADMNTTIRGQVPAAEYTGLRFILGVPFERNHMDSALAAPPLNITAMFWNWLGGYKFLRVDGVTTGLPSWRLHLGSTGCEGDMMGNVTACANPNRVEVEISDFDPDNDTLVADLRALLAEADLETDQTEAPGCMSNPQDEECAAYFSQLGLGFGQQAAKPQVFFHRE